MNLELKNNEEMDKTVSIRTLIAFSSAIGIPILVFLYTLNLRTDKNEIRTEANSDRIYEIRQAQKEGQKEDNRNFEKVLDKLHEMDLKLKDKANRK